MVGGRHNEQHGALAIIVQSPAAAKDAFAVLPQDLRAAVRIVYTRVDQRQLSGPGDFVAVDRFYAAGRYENRGRCQRRGALGTARRRRNYLTSAQGMRVAQMP